MIEPDKIAQIVALLQERFAIDAIYLYGSQAQGNTHAASDYDLAILCKPDALPSWEERSNAATDLEAIVGGDVDLLLLNDAGPIIAMQVVSKGTLLLEGHRFRHQSYVTCLYSSYAEFKELRAPMEKNILKRKYFS